MGNIPMWISIGLFVYYLIFQVFSNFIKAGISTNTPSLKISKLRSKYKVKIYTFNKNSNHLAFAWMKSIWINESLLKNNKALLFAFYHELFHVTHKHKQISLLIRLGIVLLPLLMYVVHWAIFTSILVSYAILAKKLLEYFEVKSDEFSHKMIDEESNPFK